MGEQEARCTVRTHLLVSPGSRFKMRLDLVIVVEDLFAS
jgi:hypothetical protein